MKCVIHVHKQRIAQNRKNGTNLPVLTTKTYKENTKSHEAILKTKDGTVIGKFRYADECNVKPLSCGARVWFEFDTDLLDVEHIVHE